MGRSGGRVRCHGSGEVLGCAVERRTGWIARCRAGGRAVCGHASRGAVPVVMMVDRQLPAVASADGGWQRFKLGERAGELAGPGPVSLQAKLGTAAMEREPTGDVQKAVAQALGSGLRKRAFKQERLAPREQVVRD